MKKVQTYDALTDAISLSRLEKYLSASDGNIQHALDLYAWNMRLSEAFYVPLQGFEICLRNKLFGCLSNTYGNNWLVDESSPLTNGSRKLVDDALVSLGKSDAPPSNGKIVAELKFGFWVGLLGPKYDGTIWRKSAFKAFQSKSGQSRRTVHGRINALRRLRNRVAHHEPIFHRQIENDHSEILEAIGWMCPTTSAWIASKSRVESVLAEGDAR